MDTQLKKISIDVLIQYIKDNIMMMQSTDIVIDDEPSKNQSEAKKKPISIKKEKTFQKQIQLTQKK